MISSLDLYDLLSEQLGKEKAKNLVSFVEAKVEEGLNEKTTIFATKEDIARLEGKLESKISEAKADMLKWTIVLFSPFYIGLIAFLVKYFLRS